jgi:hypothetical protein
MKRWMLAGLGFGAIALAACGGASGGGGGAPTATATPSASATFAQVPPHSEYPATDTPLGSASAALQAEWQPILTSDGSDPAKAIIPGKEVFAALPPLPTITNGTKGALTDAQVRLLVESDWRNRGLYTWAVAHGQTGLLKVIVNNNEDAATATALSQGGTVVDPACDVFPTAETVIRDDAAVDKWLADGSGTGSSSGAVAIFVNIAEGANCAELVTVNGQTTSVPDGSLPFRGVQGGAEQSGSPMGDLYYMRATASCSATHAIAAYCLAS